MELRHLRYFAAIADAQDIALAAQRLVISQKALRSEIGELEKELGFSLLRRSSSCVALTAAGQAFLKRTRAMLASSGSLADLHDARHDCDMRIRFGHYGALWADGYASALQSLALRHARAQLELIDEYPGHLVRLLNRKALDIALLGTADDALKRQFATRRLLAVPALLAMRSNHPLARRKRLEVADLGKASWVVWDERMFPGRKQLLLNAAKAAGFKPRIVHKVDSVASLFLHLTESDAIGYVLPLSRKLPHPGIAFMNLEPPGIEFEVNVAWRRDSSHVAQLGPLVELLAKIPVAQAG